MINNKIKETWMVITCVMTCLIGVSCTTTKPLNYTVAIQNEGQEEIWLAPFQLSDNSDATVAVGEVLPGGRASMSPYYCRPNSNINLAWRFLKTGKKNQVEVASELPKAFTKKSGSAIVFHIKPEAGIVDVTYEILDPRTGQLSIIRNGEVSR